jgi:hypothetical protein
LLHRGLCTNAPGGYLPVAVPDRSFLLKYRILHRQYCTISNKNVPERSLSCMQQKCLFRILEG